MRFRMRSVVDGGTVRGVAGADQNEASATGINR